MGGQATLEFYTSSHSWGIKNNHEDGLKKKQKKKRRKRNAKEFWRWIKPSKKLEKHLSWNNHNQSVRRSSATNKQTKREPSESTLSCANKLTAALLQSTAMLWAQGQNANRLPTTTQKYRSRGSADVIDSFLLFHPGIAVNIRSLFTNKLPASNSLFYF